MGGLFWLLIIVGFFYFMTRYGCGGHMAHAEHGVHGNGAIEVPTTNSIEISSTDDPVCGMPVGLRQGYSEIYQGRQYRFCSRKCLDQFDQEPRRYVA